MVQNSILYVLRSTMLRIVYAWLMLFRMESGLFCAYIVEPLHRQDIPSMPALREELVTHLSCSEVFNLTDPRNCCSIPYLLPQHVMKECLQIPLSPIALEGENCRAECVLNKTGILDDGNFQQETAIELLTNATTVDRTLAERIRDAVTKCQKIVFVATVTYLSGSCRSSSRHVLDCIFAILYKRCPLQYWSGTDECGRLVHMLNGCPYFLVHSNSY